MTDNKTVTCIPLVVIESEAMIRMHLMGKITWHQAYGVERFVKMIPCTGTTPEKNVNIREQADVNRCYRNLIARAGTQGPMLIRLFVQGYLDGRWSKFDKMYGHTNGWMKAMILFVGGQLDHLHEYQNIIKEE